MGEKEDKKYPTWQWIAITVLGIVLTMAAYGYARLDSSVSNLQTQKADKGDVVRIETKIDKIYEFLMRGNQVTNNGKPNH